MYIFHQYVIFFLPSVIVTQDNKMLIFFMISAIFSSLSSSQWLSYRSSKCLVSLKNLFPFHISFLVTFQYYNRYQAFYCYLSVKDTLRQSLTICIWFPCAKFLHIGCWVFHGIKCLWINTVCIVWAYSVWPNIFLLHNFLPVMFLYITVNITLSSAVPSLGTLLEAMFDFQMIHFFMLVVINFLTSYVHGLAYYIQYRAYSV